MHDAAPRSRERSAPPAVTEATRPPAIDAAAVVATLDRPEWLTACLVSLAAADPPYREVLVVDQSVGEAQRAIADAHGARYLHLDRRGLSLARNAGIAASVSEWIHFPDDDCTVAPDLLAAVADGLQRQPGAGFLCAHIEIPGGRPIMVGMDDCERTIAKPIDALRTAMSPGLFVRRALLERLGGFDERFGVGARFPSGEESDLLFRALVAGTTGRYLPKARVFHPDQMAIRDAEARRRRAHAYGKGWGALFAKHAASSGGAALHALYQFRAMAGVVIETMTGSPERAGIHAATLRGRREGWKEWRAAESDSVAAAGAVPSMGARAVSRWRAAWNHPVLSNTAALVVVRAANLGARVLLLLLIARQVPPSSFGLIVLALSIAEIGKVVADFGMDTLAIRQYAAGTPESHSRFAASLAAAKLIFGAAVYLGLIGILGVTQPAAQARLGWIIGSTVLTALLVNFSLDYFQSRLAARRVVVPVLLSNAAITASALLLLPATDDLRLMVAFFPVIEAVTGVVLLARLGREGLLEKPRLAFDRVPALVRRSLPIAATAIMIMTYSRMDVLVLSSRLNAAAVGAYGLAFRLTEPFQIAAATFGLSVFARFSSWLQRPLATPLRDQVLRYGFATLAYGVLAGLLLGAVAPPILERLLPQYAPSIPVLRILAGALVFRTLNATLAGILQGAGRFLLVAELAIWNLVFFFFLLQWLVGLYQAPGAALALLIGEAVNSVLQIGLVAREVSRNERTRARAA